MNTNYEYEQCKTCCFLEHVCIWRTLREVENGVCLTYCEEG